jgi:hypothetical protein
MAKFEEPFEEEIEFNDVEELSEEQQEPEAVEEPAVEEKPEVVIPDKYQGKSVEDIVKMHQEAEKLIGKQAQEVGEVRRLADELLKRQLQEKQAVETPEEKVDFSQRLYEDPESAINEAVSKHPAVTQAQQQAASFKQQQVLQKLKADFSNFDTVLQDPKFFEWIKASPVRVKLYAEADGNYDYDSASELLSTWNMINPSQPKQTSSPELVAESKKGTANDLRTASVDTGSPAPSSRKTYRRADLINLRLRDPARYEAMSDEIMAAYAEGRVK